MSQTNKTEICLKVEVYFEFGLLTGLLWSDIPVVEFCMLAGRRMTTDIRIDKVPHAVNDVGHISVLVYVAIEVRICLH